MKVFISHHIAKDERLAIILKDALLERGIDGYIAQRKQKYEILILEKIKNEIELSDYLVAIITKEGLVSASIHEEIGYAIGKNVPVILMVDEKVKEVAGVLIHGKEEHYFTRSFFKLEADEIAKYIKENGIPNRRKPKRIENVSIKKNQYLKFNPQQKLNHLKSDALSAFTKQKFITRTIQIARKEKEYSINDVDSFDIAEDKKRSTLFHFHT